MGLEKRGGVLYVFQDVLVKPDINRFPGVAVVVHAGGSFRNETHYREVEKALPPAK